jgi:hypothetical protein
MALPKLDIITYETHIPSTKQTILIRPFLVKEEKILLTALAGGDSEEIVRATKQVVNNCIVTEGVDIDKLELYDLEYLILQLRIRSVGETTKIRFMPREQTECSECKTYREVEINLTEAAVEQNQAHNKKIEITERVGLMMKSPTLKMMGKIEKAKASSDIQEFFKIIWMCVDAVYDGDELSSTKDISPKDGIEFLESLNSEQFSKIEKFFSTLPKLKQTVHVKCKTCDFEQDFVLVGLENFFA